ncbi:MAG: plasmid stabilization protein [Robiginitomaculum sp.]|nr:MAG: plasmid stabilization protein [Robiginitomaculum sp.]
MPKYQLSELARQNLLEIARYGDKNYGIQKSDQYRDKLKRQFEVLTEQPYLFQSVEHIREGYRRCVCGAHSIYYRIEGDGVQIMAIIGQQDITKLT